MRLPQLKIWECVFVVGILCAHFAGQDKKPDAPVVPSDLQVRFLQAQHKVDTAKNDSATLDAQYLQFHKQIADRQTQSQFQLDAIAKEAQGACGDPKEFVFDRESQSCKAPPAPEKAQTSTPETQAKK